MDQQNNVFTKFWKKNNKVLAMIPLTYTVKIEAYNQL